MRSTTKASVIKRSTLTETEVDQMWLLFESIYADISKKKFVEDLNEKSHVAVLRDGKNIVGFSTILVYQSIVKGTKVRVLFSGDSLKDRRYWGDKKINFAFLKFAFMIWLKNPFQEFYWYLISKGYKTYLVGKKSFPDFWPNRHEETPSRQKEVIEHLSIERYGDAFVADQGILDFSIPMGRLKDDAVPVTEQELKVPDIAYYIAKNPLHAKGNELCCLAEFNLKLWGFVLMEISPKFGMPVLMNTDYQFQVCFLLGIILYSLPSV